MPRPPTAAQQPGRRLFYIGPGLIIALILAVLIAANWYRGEMRMRKAKSGPPIVERQITSSDLDPQMGPAPQVSFLLERRGKLKLTHEQMRELESIQNEWKKLYGPKIAEANRVAEEAGRYLESSKRKGRTPTAQIQDRAAELIALSREISTARRRYWDRAMSALTVEQRKLVNEQRESLWSRRSAARQDIPRR